MVVLVSGAGGQFSFTAGFAVKPVASAIGGSYNRGLGASAKPAVLDYSFILLVTKVLVYGGTLGKQFVYRLSHRGQLRPQAWRGWGGQVFLPQSLRYISFWEHSGGTFF